MAETLTPRQRNVMEFVCATIRTRGFPPTVREIAAELGIRSTNAVQEHLAALEKKGFLKREPCRSRGLLLTQDAIATFAPVAYRRGLPAEDVRAAHEARGGRWQGRYPGGDAASGTLNEDWFSSTWGSAPGWELDLRPCDADDTPMAWPG